MPAFVRDIAEAEQRGQNIEVSELLETRNYDSISGSPQRSQKQS